MRHGARYPNDKQVAASKQFIKELQAHRSKNNPNNYERNELDDLVVTFDDKPNYGLSDLGKQEMAEIAKRFSKRYSNLFNTDELKFTLNTQSSSKERCIDSSKS